MRAFIFIIFFVFSGISVLWAAIGSHGSEGVGEIHSAHTLKDLQMRAGLYNRVLSSSDIFQEGTFKYQNIEYPVEDFVSISSFPIVGLGLGNNFEAILGVPVYFDYMRNEQFSASGIGDFRAKMKFRLSQAEVPGAFALAFLLEAYGGTASNDDGLVPRDLSYYREDNELSPYGRKQIYVGMTAATTLDFEVTSLAWPLKWHINSGYTFPVGDFPGVIAMGSAVELNINKYWSLSTDILHKSRENRFGTTAQFESEYMVAGGNIFFTTGKGVTLSVGATRDILQGGFENISQVGTEFNVHPERNWIANTAIHWTGFITPQDQDKDGVTDEFDLCRFEPEDRDGFEDADGCPEIDNDKDGLIDKDDKCPNLPEDKDDFEDADGCPDYDNDQDNKSDENDTCPNEAEDIDGFEDADGCPDIDNDVDGVLDVNDQCPFNPEDRDGYKDEDGCPDLDNDNDGILDTRDKCPLIAENLNKYQDSDGCPEEIKSKVIEVAMSQVLKGVRFKLGTTDLTFESYENLDKLAQKLRYNPSLSYEIHVHTDNKLSMGKALSMSGKQAKAIRSYLMSQGVASSQLIAIGEGYNNPRSSNGNARGRAQNRRIELVPK